MGTLALIGLLGGLITGISPCILPVLPVIFMSSTDTGPRLAGGRVEASTGGVTTIEKTETARGLTARPFLVILGLVVSFATFTLVGSAVLSLLGLPQDALRWIGLVALVLIGVGLIVPRFEELLERPFSWIPQRQVNTERGGFLLGLAIGAVYVPCAGPVLAAIAVAGATGEIGLKTIVLTVSFAIGAAIPLLFFALAGQRVSQRIRAFRERQRLVRVVSGVVMILLAVALVFNLPQVLQRAIPDYTSGLQEKVADPQDIQQQLLTNLVNDQNRELDKCTNGATQLQSCGPAPDIKGIAGWFNTPGDKPVTLPQQRGKVVLLDFWAYSCINCQRSIPHVVSWYDKYKDLGLEVIGIHSPEYAFEKDRANVIDGAKRLGIAYPVAQDNSLSTWTNYRNRYWPAHYLIDASGTVRHIKFGEGEYGVTEDLIRQLLKQANPSVKLPSPSDLKDTAPQVGSTTAETYLSYGRFVNYGGQPRYQPEEASFTVPTDQRDDTFALGGRWDVTYENIAPKSDDATISLKYHAQRVFLVVGGTGTVTVDDSGTQKRIQVTGPPTLYPVHDGTTNAQGELRVQLSQGLSAYSFTYG